MTTDGINLRELSLFVLLAVEKDKEYCSAALAAVLDKYQYLSKKERSFVTRLAEGTLEKQIELDYIIELFSKIKIKKMKPVIRCILRMGVYQFKYMDAVPDSAACNEAVRLAKKKGFGNLTGFVNGVLRSVARNLDAIPYPKEGENPLYALSVKTSIPEWILTQWGRDYGKEKAKSIAEAFGKESRTGVRANRMKISPAKLKNALRERGFSAEPAVLKEYPDFDYAMYLSGYDYLSAIPEFLEGMFFVQDICSMLVTHLARPKPSDYVIDVCSAPGAKSLHAAEWVSGGGFVEARDISEYKTSLVEENIRRCGAENIRTKVWDARMRDEDSIEKADLVIADLPCSGLGTMQKKPDIRYRMTEDMEKSLALLQREILNVAADYVKPGGTLVFSTCTIDRMENEENAIWFLEKKPEFSLDMERQFFPDEGEYDGFYIAKFIKNQRKL